MKKVLVVLFFYMELMATTYYVDAKNDFFNIDVEAPFMLKGCDVLENKKEVIPTVTHADGSARLQTEGKDLHPRYYEIIKKFGEKTGIPVLLNTSFNIMGEPLVESPKDAIRCFYTNGLDVLVMGNYLLKKGKRKT